jgi:predicted ATPase with chaperone activity
MDAGMARDVLNTLEQQGRLNKRQIDHVSRYSIKQGFSAVVGAQAAARASTVQVCVVSLYRMEVTG